MRLSKLTIAIFLFLCSCVTPYEVNTVFVEQLVVEGQITDQPGPYLVKISKTVPINQQFYKTSPISHASVVIQDDQGNSEALYEGSSGNYYTYSTQGVIGRSYSIKITTAEGGIYQSKPEKLLPVGDFDNLRYEFVQNESPNSNRQITSKNGFKIYLNSHVLPEQEGRVWWRLTGTFEIFTYPRLRTKQELRGNQWVTVPDPPGCSGYIRVGDGIYFLPGSKCYCCTCWVTQYNQVPVISDPSLIFNNEINNFNVGFVEANIRIFYDKYYLEVEQLSVSQAVYDFWKIIKTQKQNSSNLFQTPPPATATNIVSLTPNSPSVIGYFAAVSSKKHVLVMNRTDVPYEMQPIDTLKISCIDAYKLSSNAKPLFW